MEAMTDGLEQVAGSPALVGPFRPRRNGVNGFEIVGGDGTVAVWCYGEVTATSVAAVLNKEYWKDTFEEKKAQ